LKNDFISPVFFTAKWILKLLKNDERIINTGILIVVSGKKKEQKKR
jgi:hypothetical protein